MPETEAEKAEREARAKETQRELGRALKDARRKS